MWVFNTRHDFGVETDSTQGEFFGDIEIDRSSALVREIIQNQPLPLPLHIRATKLATTIRTFWVVDLIYAIA
jgi:hypothetical protein